MNKDLPVIAALLDDLSAKKTISQDVVVNIENLYGSNPITSVIPLNKFTKLDSNVNFEDAKSLLEYSIKDTASLDVELMKKSVSKLINELTSFKSFGYTLKRLSDKWEPYNPFLFFLNDAKNSNIYLGDKLISLNDYSVIDFFGNKYPWVVDMFMDYLNKQDPNKYNDELKSLIKTEYFSDLSDFSFPAVQDDQSAPTHSAGFLELCRDVNEDFLRFTPSDFKTLNQPEMTIGELKAIFSSSGVKTAYNKLNSYLNRLRADYNALSNKDNNERSCAKLLGIKIDIEVMSSLSNSPIVERLMKFYNIGDMHAKGYSF